MMFKTKKMKNITLCVVTTIIFIVLSSCHQDIDGGGDPLMLSRKAIAIPPDGGEGTVTILQKRRAWIEGAQFWDNDHDKDGQDISSSSNGSKVDHEWFSAWFKIEDGYEVIYVRLTPNDTGFKRRVTIALQSMNVFECFNVYQDPI